MNGLIDLSEVEFKQIAGLVYDRFGIHLTEKKTVLVRGRLNKLIRHLGFSTFSDYYNYLVNDRSGQSLADLIDRISTNHSYFFRERDHFDHMVTNALPQLEQQKIIAGPDDLRLWCAGCAAGEEPYTQAIFLSEYFHKTGSWKRPIILATDISMAALISAKRGIYTEERIRNVPENLRKKYFKPVDGQRYQVKDFLKKMILFKQLNLMDDQYPFSNKFHMIFFRNVMIYFDQQTKKQVVNKMASCIEKAGYYYIGHSETLGRDNGFFKYIQPALYQRE